MKDNLFEMLMDFFEKSLSKIKASTEQESLEDVNEQQSKLTTLNLRPAASTSQRVFTLEERLKLTKASYQFLMQMMRQQIISPDLMEQIISQLCYSESRFVTLEETKWVMRTILGAGLEQGELAFLDLVLHQNEDKHLLH